MQYSDIKKIKKFCESLESNPDWREVVRKIEDRENNFEVDGVRFIEDKDINEILEDELSCDTYVLGCFNAWAIADATDWPIALIEIAQQTDKGMETLGEAMTGEHITHLAAILVSNDGYGHHFNRWDGSEEEFEIGDSSYHVFDNH